MMMRTHNTCLPASSSYPSIFIIMVLNGYSGCRSFSYKENLCDFSNSYPFTDIIYKKIYSFIIMCQLSLPAEYLLSLPSQQALTNPTITATNNNNNKKTVSFTKPVGRTIYKMQYTSVIVLGFLNAFALAVPLRMCTPIPFPSSFLLLP